MEIKKKTTQMRTGKGCLFRACCNKGVSHYHLPLVRLQGREGSFTVKKGKALGLLQLEATGEGAGGRLTRSSFLHGWFGKHIWLSLA